MTKEEILAMEAGEELDALIDKEIFSGNGCVHDLYWVDPDEYACSKCHKQFVSPEPWAYSTTISAAWQVVEKMRDSHRYNIKRIEEGRNAKGQYDDTFVNFCSLLMDVLGIEIKEYAYGATLTIMRALSPEAICKAALLAKLEIRK